MTIQLRWTKMATNDVGAPLGVVDLFVGDAADSETSKEWISARVKVAQPNILSHALLEIAAVEKARDLLNAESERLSILYRASETAQR
jgi:hypothetical protein